MTRNYNDWVIRIEKADNEENEFVAEFYIPNGGKKRFLQYYRYIAEKKTKPGMVFERIKRIIDALYKE